MSLTKFRNHSLAINSILIVVSTTIIGTILHESSHFLLAYFFGLKAELHSNYVSYNSDVATEFQNVLIAGIGPMVSLFSGILFLIVSIKLIKPSLLKLFFLWLGLNGILNFLGYILIAPFAKAGDTGKVFDYLNFPTLISIGIAFICLFGIILLFKRVSKEFRFYKSQESFNQLDISKQLFLYPIIGSIIFMVILNLPVKVWLSMLPIIFVPLSYLSIMKSYNKLKIDAVEVEIGGVSKLIIVISILIVIFYKFIL